MGETEEKDNHGDEVEKKEKKEKTEDESGKEAKEKKKKKDKDGKEKEGNEEGGKEKKKKNPEDKKDPVILKQKLEKLDVKMQALVAKREEILKLLNEIETNSSEPPLETS